MTAKYLEDFLDELARQRAFSLRVFGPGRRTVGITEHIKKELDEIRAEPLKLEEWVDVLVLAMDGATRAGHIPEKVIRAWTAKMQKVQKRRFPDWKGKSEDEPIEHIRE